MKLKIIEVDIEKNRDEKYEERLTEEMRGRSEWRMREGGGGVAALQRSLGYKGFTKCMTYPFSGLAFGHSNRVFWPIRQVYIFMFLYTYHYRASFVTTFFPELSPYFWKKN